MEDIGAVQLIREIASGTRILTDSELKAVIEHIADAGFDPLALERARGRAAGIEWRGRIVRSSDMLPPAEVHYLRHVVAGHEWPDDTDLSTFLSSITALIRDEHSGLLFSSFQGTDQITIVRRSVNLRGPDGFEWVLVDYRLATGHWVTVFQPHKGLDILQSPKRSGNRVSRHAASSSPINPGPRPAWPHRADTNGRVVTNGDDDRHDDARYRRAHGR